MAELDETTTKLTEELYGVVSDHTEFELSLPVFTHLFKDERYLLAQVDHWGASDTVVREEGMELLMKKLIGRAWPTYGEKLTDEEFDELMSSMETAHAKLALTLAT